MKRRDFLKTTGTAGLSGFAQQGCSSLQRSSENNTPGFAVHPVIRKHPKAVFIHKTSIESKSDSEAIRNAAFRLSREIIVPTEKEGFPKDTKVLVKPNWTNNGLLRDRENDFDILGVHTDLNFLDGWMQGMQGACSGSMFLRDCAMPQTWDLLGYRAFADSNGYDLQDLSSKPVWEYPEGDINVIPVPEGTVFKEIGLMSPAGDSDVFLMNMAKLKSHGMGITGAVKNIQGLCAHTFHTFCRSYDSIRTTYDKKYHRYFYDDFEKSIGNSYEKHVADRISRWDRPGRDGGIWMETWVQRILDAHTVIKPDLNIIEGIYAHEGDGLGRGPNGRGTDKMSNVVIFGLDPFRVDIIAHWLAGHEPGNFGLFHIANERGLSDVLDPFDIPVYEWKDGKAIAANLDNFKRTPLLTYYLARDYGRGHEPRYHLVDEEFDYKAWKDRNSVKVL